jgi:hypothetical protein
VLGSFGKSTIEESIQSEGEAEQTGEYGGFTLYETAGSTSPGGFGGFSMDSTSTAAAGEGALILGFSVSGSEDGAGVTGDQAARKMIDAGNGDAELLRANSDYATQLDDRIGDSSVVFGGQVDPGLVEAATQGSSGMQGQFISGLRAGGFGMNVDGETTTMNAVAIYTDAEAAEQSGVQELVDLASQQAVEGNPGLDSLSASYDGSAVIVTIEGDTQTIFEQGTAAGPGSGFSVSRPRSVPGAVGVPEP